MPSIKTREELMRVKQLTEEGSAAVLMVLKDEKEPMAGSTIIEKIKMSSGNFYGSKQQKANGEEKVGIVPTLKRLHVIREMPVKSKKAGPKTTTGYELTALGKEAITTLHRLDEKINRAVKSNGKITD